MSARKLRTNAVGITAQADLFPDMPRVPSVVPFPDRAVRKRVVVERPEPTPVTRCCPTCGATFDDYTQRTNTIYCRAWCKTKMSYIKRDSAIELLSKQPGMNPDKAFVMVVQGGLPKAEKLLNLQGYRFERDVKAWVK